MKMQNSLGVDCSVQLISVVHLDDNAFDLDFAKRALGGKHCISIESYDCAENFIRRF